MTWKAATTRRGASWRFSFDAIARREFAGARRQASRHGARDASAASFVVLGRNYRHQIDRSSACGWLKSHTSIGIVDDEWCVI